MKKPLPPAEIFNKHAEIYQEQYRDIGRYEDTFDMFCNSIREGSASVLEVACGPGNVTQYLLAKRPELQILGTDFAPNMIRLAQINNPTATFQVMDARDIGQLGNTYDAILCGFGLPYLSREEAITFIADAARVLNANGVLYISTMEDDYSKSGIKHSVTTGDSTYMYYHEAGYLTEALEAHHFHILSITRKASQGADGTPYTDLVIIARK
ncbi:MAG: methyltransferase domain-containing protein [Chitinophaga sp.]|uniref:class I SAM-dependent methyltransferase n=1 Tax=Chitinophaga sp. TaxID=1869181 RepID=UPI001B2979EB|nr:class I SAM-dependent methyltransferase [Chitinophaga sp.]MBO9729651.1 methyltransferase domain-containing protein [Chitinophaga sp.]